MDNENNQLAPEIGRYQSQQGFVKTSVVRGLAEIKPLFDLIKGLNENLKDVRLFICGGYVRFMCSPREKVSTATDVDIYCRDNIAFELIKDEFRRIGLEIRNENEIAVTYKIPQSGEYQYIPTVQLIKSLNQGAIVASGTMEEILNAFDFTVIRGGLLSETEALVDADFIHDETKRLLRIKNIHCPISSTLRFMKYAKKGYWASPLEICKLFSDWDNRSGDYKVKIIDGIKRIEEGQTLSEEDIFELEKLMKID